jgi:hypothetical protein
LLYSSLVLLSPKLKFIPDVVKMKIVCLSVVVLFYHIGLVFGTRTACRKYLIQFVVASPKASYTGSSHCCLHPPLVICRVKVAAKASRVSRTSSRLVTQPCSLTTVHHCS